MNLLHSGAAAGEVRAGKQHGRPMRVRDEEDVGRRGFTWVHWASAESIMKREVATDRHG